MSDAGRMELSIVLLKFASGETADVFERFWTDFVCGRLCPSKDKNPLLLKILDVVLEQVPTKDIVSVSYVMFECEFLRGERQDSGWFIFLQLLLLFLPTS